ncbi:hypothetical protein ACM66B_004401 [Microbotryomycetes sp. NB124-2]
MVHNGGSQADHIPEEAFWFKRLLYRRLNGMGLVPEPATAAEIRRLFFDELPGKDQVSEPHKELFHKALKEILRKAGPKKWAVIGEIFATSFLTREEHKLGKDPREQLVCLRLHRALIETITTRQPEESDDEIRAAVATRLLGSYELYKSAGETLAQPVAFEHFSKGSLAIENAKQNWMARVLKLHHSHRFSYTELQSLFEQYTRSIKLDEVAMEVEHLTGALPEPTDLDSRQQRTLFIEIQAAVFESVWQALSLHPWKDEETNVAMWRRELPKTWAHFHNILGTLRTGTSGHETGQSERAIRRFSIATHTPRARAKNTTVNVWQV